MTKPPNPIDVHVGGRLRLQRMIRGLSQEKLGEALGVTFQQIQKYEKGSNRIGASRLEQIARVLDVPPSFFFEGLPSSTASGGPGFEEAGQNSYASNLLLTSDGLQLNRAFVRISDPKVRRKIVELVCALAEPGSDPGRKR